MISRLVKSVFLYFSLEFCDIISISKKVIGIEINNIFTILLSSTPIRFSTMKLHLQGLTNISYKIELCRMINRKNEMLDRYNKNFASCWF